jgi:hypothetical protein
MMPLGGRPQCEIAHAASKKTAPVDQGIMMPVTTRT